MITVEEITQKLQNAMEGAQIEVMNPQNDGKHFFAKVIWSGFKDMGLVQMHQHVYGILKEEMKEEIHALGLDTKAE